MRWWIIPLLMMAALPLVASAQGADAIVFSEIAWMGTAVSANDEWMELHNDSESPVDLTGWIILKGGQPWVELAGTVEAGGYFLLERTDDTSAPEAPADQIYTGSLSNDGETLLLIRADGTEADRVDAWLAGDNATKQTMQRSAPDTWCTADVTPRQGSACGAAENDPAAEGEPLTEEAGEPPAPEVPQEPPITEPTQRLIITEVMPGSEVNPERDHWLELYNPTDEEVLLDGWQISGVTAGGSWVEITAEPGRAVQPGAYFLISHYTNSDSSALAVWPQVQKTSLVFPGDPLAIQLRDAEENLVDSVVIDREDSAGMYASYERVDALTWLRAHAQIGLKDGLQSTFATPLSPPDAVAAETEDGVSPPEAGWGVVISEILPDPKRYDITDEFIELQNIGDETVDLFGWELDDENLDDDQSYVFADEQRDYLLLPGAFLVLNRFETGISLGNLGDGVHLFDADGNVADEYFYAPYTEGRSRARDPDNPDEWIFLNHPTPGTENRDVNRPPFAAIGLQKDSRYMGVNVTAADSFDPDGDALLYAWDFGDGGTDDRENPAAHLYDAPGAKTIHLTVTDEFGLSVEAEMPYTARPKDGISLRRPRDYPSYALISEIMPNPAGNDEEGEWIELFNGTGAGIDLSGWFVDDAAGGSRPFPIPAGTYLEADRHLVFAAPELKLSFKNTDDEARLLDPNGTARQTVSYSTARESESYAFAGEGVFSWTPLATPGSPNQFPEPPRSYIPGDVVIESVLPNPDGGDSGRERIALRNDMTEPVDLAGWSLTDRQNDVFVFESFFLNAGERATIEQDLFRLNLNNADDALILSDPAGNAIDSLAWKEAGAGQWVIHTDHLRDGLAAVVLRVIDGDTVAVDLEGKMLTVRMIGLDTPETVHPFKPIEFYGRQASDHLKNRLTGQTVRLDFDANKTDKYGRLLAYVYLGDVFINAEMIELGYGYAYLRFPFRYRDDFAALEDAAKAGGLGLWQNLKIRHLIESEEWGVASEEGGPEALMVEEVGLPEVELEEVSPPEAGREVVSEGPDCQSDALMIDAILPNAKQGESVEFIRLKNGGDLPVCLSGWSLDDAPQKGSKPFAVRGGAIAPGGVRTFRRPETKIALNNTDDCASLIAPDGTMADKICYAKTHAGELFTHAGGDWQPRKRALKSKAGTQRAARPPVAKTSPFTRTASAYQWDLANRAITGRIERIDEDAHLLYIVSENKTPVSISYAGSPVDVRAAKQLLDFNQPVTLRLRGTKGAAVLVAIEPVAAPAAWNRLAREFLGAFSLFLPGL